MPMSGLDATPPRPTPLTEHIEIEIEQSADELRVLGRMTVDPGNPILAGHYPDRPIFPGVCLVECVHRAVLVAGHSRGVEPVLAELPTARFLDAVLPGDTVDIDAKITRGRTRWKAAATLSGPRGPVARIALLYAVPGDAS
jgi:3-hydroxyacyl-[acyl-carrier-protein] dehydratase